MIKDSKVVNYWQTLCVLHKRPRGFHIITADIQRAMALMPEIKMGLAHFFIQHTSASLTISENTCEDVRLDLETYFNHEIPENNSLYRHTLEGEDDMPAHIKNVMLGTSLTIPLNNNQLMLGTWQGIYLCEHRNEGTERRIVITVDGV